MEVSSRWKEIEIDGRKSDVSENQNKSVEISAYSGDCHF